MAGKFYSVATPIGNLGDFSFRALEVLKSVDLIICEDTRVTKVLLDKYGISTNLKSYHKFNEQERTDEILNELSQGKNIALVSDAGTPCVCDPGCVVVERLYEQGIQTASIPGACAITTFLSIVPRDSEEFLFVGFLPRKVSEQKELFIKCKNFHTVFYESPKRLARSLQNISDFAGEETEVAIGRELTKKFENIKIDTAKNLSLYYEQNPPKGEIVGLIYKQSPVKNDNSAEIVEQIEKLREKGFSAKDISTVLSELFGYRKNCVYELAMKIF